MALAKTVPVPGSGLREALIGTKGVNKTETPVLREALKNCSGKEKCPTKSNFAIFNICLGDYTSIYNCDSEVLKHKYAVSTRQKCG